MPQKKTKKKEQYYTVVFEKYLEVLEEVDRFYIMLADKLKELTTRVPIVEWADSPIPDFTEAYTHIYSFSMFLDEKINNPSDEEIQFTVKNNVKDVLFREDELAVMQKSYIQMQAIKQMLYNVHNFSSEIN